MTRAKSVTLHRKGRLLVAFPSGKTPRLRASIVEQTRQRLTRSPMTTARPGSSSEQELVGVMARGKP